MEFALVLPVLLSLLLGMIDYGYVYFTQLTLTNAAREGARVGVTRGNQGDAESQAVAAATQYLESANLMGHGMTPAIAAAMTASATDFMVRVNIDLPFTPLIGFIPALPDNLHASAVMRWEGPLP